MTHETDPLAAFHPAVATWFRERFAAPTAAQANGWPAVARGRDTLIAAPTGSGKTLAAFLWCLDVLVRKAAAGTLEDRTEVVYVSPLKALGNDIEKNLQVPLAGIAEVAERLGVALSPIRAAVRSGDTPMADRARMAKRPPHVLITTPESLYILLTAARSRAALETVRTVIVDEIHAVAGSKRGSHLCLSLERLDAAVLAAGGARPVRIGLSATQRPIDAIGRLLVGSGRPQPDIVDSGHSRALDLAVMVPDDELSAVATGDMMSDVYDRIAALVREHRTTLVFVNTRRLAERATHALGQRLGEDAVAAHHGSLARQRRLDAEQRLKHAEVRCVVATASLELGIDVGDVELTVQIGSPRSIATFLQRTGRSGHSLGGTPKGRLFAVTRDQLVECAALVRGVRRGVLDAIVIPQAPLDILAQQIVAEIACGEMDEDALFELVRRAAPYASLPREEFDAVLRMQAEGVASRRGRGAAHLHYDAVNRRVRPRRGARLAAITSGGAIPDRADYSVIAEPDEMAVGTVDEDFAIESMAGDVFLLGNTSWRIRRIEPGRVRVEDAKGQAPTVPFWFGEAPARTAELSAEVAALRASVEADLAAGVERGAIAARLMAEAALAAEAAEQVVAYLAAGRAALGVLPTDRRIVAERFFDEAGGMQLVLHSPLGGRINRAWGLALRKRFCVSFNFELQASATDDGIVISLGPQHSFPLESVFDFLHPDTAEAVLTQAVLGAPMFGVRWRWNATRSLALLRFQGGKRVPPPILRMRSDDLIAAVFPDQQACQENIVGPIAPPDHPLVTETLRDCLNEAMDINGLCDVLRGLRSGEISTVAIETTEPSPLSHELLNANPYAFLDDAPLEERRARAVALRRGLGDALEGGLGALDASAIAMVVMEASPVVRDADELHDHLLTVGLLPAREARAWPVEAEALIDARRAVWAAWRGERGALVASERVRLVRAAIDDVAFTPDPPPVTAESFEPDAARLAIVRGHLEGSGPTTSAALAERLGLDESGVSASLAELESDGLVLRGRFTPSVPISSALAGPSPREPARPGKQPGPLPPFAEIATPALRTYAPTSPDTPLEWCDRRILARIHRLTLGRLRREIEPVSAADYMRFLFRWQHVLDGTRLAGADGLLHTIAQLEGFEVAAAAWERDVLPVRLNGYDPSWLDGLCYSGDVVWGRLSPREATPGPAGRAPPTRAAPISLALREHLPSLLLRPELRTTEEISRATAAPSAGAARPAAPLGSSFARPIPSGVPSGDEGLSHPARDVFACIRARGALFLPEIHDAVRRLPCEVEDALWELVSSGLVTADGFAGLRALLTGAQRRGRSDARRRRPVRPGRGLGTVRGAGRWSLLVAAPGTAAPEAVARRLLRRYGVVVRDVLAREPALPPWRELLMALRRLEARGEVRGGRFVAGFVGEQFALPEAVESLRAVRRAKGPPELVRLSAADPLNLVGITSPGPRVPAVLENVVLYRDGVPIASREGGDVRLRVELEAGLRVGPELTLQRVGDSTVEPAPARARSRRAVSRVTSPPRPATS